MTPLPASRRLRALPLRFRCLPLQLLAALAAWPCLAFAGGPANDSCATAAAVSAGDFPIAGTLAGATSSFPVNFGKLGVSNGPDVWFDYTAAESGLHEFTLAPDDPGDDLALIYLLTFQDCSVGDGLDSAPPMGPGEPETRAFTLSGGEGATFMIRGFNPSDNGSFVFSLEVTPSASVGDWAAY